MFSPLDQFDVSCLIFLRFFSFDFSFTSVLLPLFLLINYLFIIFVYLNTYLKLIPTSFQLAFESIFIFIINIIKNQIGSGGYLYLPFIFTVFLFILCSNFISLMPFGIALTSHVILLLLLSLGLSLAVFLLGLLNFEVRFLKVFVPEAPLLLIPLLVLIEIFSYIVRSFSLAIRLAANILAGHTLVFIIATFIITVGHINIFGMTISFIVLLAILVLETFVAFLQAYVYTILICIYLNDAVNGPSH